MFSRCLVCHAPFPESAELEHLGRGERVAYDPERGRLWLVCAGCRRWTLAPISERWEALEELERGVTDRGRLLASTDAIGLFRLGDLDVVRVGEAERGEEAWWRFGEGLVRRRRRWATRAGIAVAAGGAVVAGGLVAGVGVLGALNLASAAFNLTRLHAQRGRFGSSLWEGAAPCEACGAVLREVRWEEQERLTVTPGDGGEDGAISVRFRCWRCGRDSAEAGYRFPEPTGSHLLRRALAHQNRRGARSREVRRAVRVFEEEGGEARAVLEAAARRHTQLAELDRTGLLVLEIASSEERERRLLEMEVAALEDRWREEERLAAIVDGELTPLPALDRLRRAPGSGGGAGGSSGAGT